MQPSLIFLCGFVFSLLTGNSLATGLVDDANPTTDSYAQPATSDNQIVQQIKQKINKENILKGSVVTISALEGKVKVIGVVATKLQHEKIKAIVDSVPRVASRDLTNLKISDEKLTKMISDSYITSEVKKVLIQKKLLSLTKPSAIHVETKEQVVYVTGKVSSQQQAQKIIKAIAAVSNVKKVQDGLQVDIRNY